jgi:nucleoside-diphosphate-sugar epimerase
VDVEKTILDISSLESFIDYNPKKLDEGIKDFIAHLSKQRTDGK